MGKVFCSLGRSGERKAHWDWDAGESQIGNGEIGGERRKERTRRSITGSCHLFSFSSLAFIYIHNSPNIRCEFD